MSKRISKISISIWKCDLTLRTKIDYIYFERHPVLKFAASWTGSLLTQSKIVIHAGANDVRLRQSEITKNNVKEVCELASTMSDTVICSGPLPAYRGDEIHSRLSSLNDLMSKWCPQNNIGFIDNWTSFWGRHDLLKRDGVHPSWGGAAILSRNLAHSLRVHT